MRFATMLVALLLLAGCEQYDAARQANLAAAVQARAASDDAKCRSSGAKSGSPEYDDCRKRWENQHAQESDRQRDIANQMLNAHPLRQVGQ